MYHNGFIIVISFMVENEATLLSRGRTDPQRQAIFRQPLPIGYNFGLDIWKRLVTNRHTPGNILNDMASIRPLTPDTSHVS